MKMLSILLVAAFCFISCVPATTAIQTVHLNKLTHVLQIQERLNPERSEVNLTDRQVKFLLNHMKQTCQLNTPTLVPLEPVLYDNKWYVTFILRCLPPYRR